MRGRHLLPLLLVAISLGTPSPPVAAVEIGNCFSKGPQAPCTEPALEHEKFKAVVLQFVDPAKTDLGESFARLIWREIRDNTYGLKGTGVIVGYDRQGDEINRTLGDKDYRLFLEAEYHVAAETIAQQLKAQMSIWGAVIVDGDGLLVQ